MTKEDLQPDYKIILFDGHAFEECTIDRIYPEGIFLKEHPYYEYFFGEKDNTVFIEFESGYSYDTVEYEYAVKGDASELFKSKLRDEIMRQEYHKKEVERRINNLEQMLDFVC